jgi:Glycoside hydrolase family 44
VTIGTTSQFNATVSGTGNYNATVNWSVAGPTGWTGSVGSISASGLYETPYPAPPSVTVTARAVGDVTKLGTAMVTLSPPAPAAGPSLTVDAGDQTRAINPYIYGMNAFSFVNTVDASADPTVLRWGGDNTSRYNYQLGVTSAGADWYFENGMGAMGPTGQFNDLVTSNDSIGAVTMGTVPVQGWVARDSTSCGFPVSVYPQQQSVDPYGKACGNGVYPQGVNGCTNSNGCNITGNDPTTTSIAEGPAWAGAWVTSLVQTFGSASNGGVAIYDLDNEPDWWDATHRDVHPQPFTYDELTTNDLATALAVKTADPTAEIAGPVLSYWWSFFYSKKDIENGWGSGPCYQPWQNPVDRQAHGGIPYVEYYLQQFRDYATAHDTPRLLDYLDLHLYFAAQYKGSGVGLSAAGDTGEQQARLNSTRVFWDPTYTDPNYPQPNYFTDSNYTASCSTPLQAPQLIPLMQSWIANNYPGTKTATTEYNWGGQEQINGALAQADLLGIFGKYGLDLATLWGPPDASQVPGLMAFAIYRNYDGAGSKFGDIALASTSAAQGQLSVYAAVRSSDQAVTVVVINKTYGDLTSTLSLANLTAIGKAKVYQYSNSNLAAIAALPDQAVTPPAAGSTTSTITAAFPAASITLFVIPTQ